MFFVLRLSVPAFETVFFRSIRTQTNTGGKGFAHGFMERTTRRCWNRTAVADLSLAWQLRTMLRVVALF